MKQGAIFDMDGLLLDTERLYKRCWLETAEAFGQKPDLAFFEALSGTAGQVQRDIILRFYPHADVLAMQRFCIARTEAILDREGAPAKPGARELLAFLRSRGVPTAVASSNTHARIQANLASTGLSGAFDLAVSGQDVSRGKPEPDIFLLAAKRLGFPPEDCYVFEDSVNGVRAGVAAGCCTVMVPDQIAPPPDLTGMAAVCRSLLEARDLMEAGRL